MIEDTKKIPLRELILSSRFDPMLRGKWREIAINRPSEEVETLLSEGFQEGLPQETPDQTDTSAQGSFQFVDPIDEEC